MAKKEDNGLGNRMRYLRNQRNLSLDQLAKITGLNKSYLSRIERQLAVPTITTALKVSKAFGLGIGQLLGEVADATSICIVRKGEGKPFMAYRKGSEGGIIFRLLPAVRTKKWSHF